MKKILTKQIVTILIAVFITTATANAIGTLTPQGTAGDQTHYSLNDIYTKITTGNSTSTKSGTIAVPEGTPTASFRTLTEIYEALPEWRTLSDSTTTVQEGYYEATDLTTIDSDLIAANIATGTEVFGVEGTLIESEELEWSPDGQTGNYSTAVSYCASLDTSGGEKPGETWRLPTTSELIGHMADQYIGRNDNGFSESGTFQYRAVEASYGDNHYTVQKLNDNRNVSTVRGTADNASWKFRCVR
jgi:hypothetical protein